MQRVQLQRLHLCSRPVLYGMLVESVFAFHQPMLNPQCKPEVDYHEAAKLRDQSLSTWCHQQQPSESRGHRTGLRIQERGKGQALQVEDKSHCQKNRRNKGSRIDQEMHRIAKAKVPQAQKPDKQKPSL